MTRLFRISLAVSALTAAISLLNSCTIYEINSNNDENPVVEKAEEPAVDEYIQNLIEYADENVKTLTVSSSSYSQTFEEKDIRYLLADVSGDRKEELIAVGLYAKELSHFKVFYDNGESIDAVHSGHIGFLEGHWQSIAFYENEYFIFYESGSTATNLEISLNRYNPLHEGPSRPLIPVIKTHQQFDWLGTGVGDTYYINDCITEDVEKYNMLREAMTASCLSEDDFMTLEELADEYGVVLGE